MLRIKIKDLPRDKKISKEELKMVMGGYTTYLTTSYKPLTMKQVVRPPTGAYNAPYFVLRPD
jgi:hypothetical protein